jgi:2-iminobutanoate/2-iminopropanoate deaminase
MQIVIRLSIFILLLFPVVVTAEDTSDRKHIFPWEKPVGYSQVVKVDNTLYLSGITSSEKTLKGQMADIYRNIEKILSEYQLNMDHIVKEVIYTTDIEKLKAETALRKSFFKNGLYPASSWVQVERLFNPNEMIEIEVIAQKPAKPKFRNLGEHR